MTPEHPSRPPTQLGQYSVGVDGNAPAEAQSGIRRTSNDQSITSLRSRLYICTRHSTSVKIHRFCCCCCVPVHSQLPLRPSSSIHQFLFTFHLPEAILGSFSFWFGSFLHLFVCFVLFVFLSFGFIWLRSLVCPVLFFVLLKNATEITSSVGANNSFWPEYFHPFHRMKFNLLPDQNVRKLSINCCLLDIV